MGVYIPLYKFLMFLYCSIYYAYVILTDILAFTIYVIAVSIMHMLYWQLLAYYNLCLLYDCKWTKVFESCKI